ncbi:MAG TPA: hypothetical protein V6C85_37625, partial [Allocoleopsis sp.]
MDYLRWKRLLSNRNRRRDFLINIGVLVGLGVSQFRGVWAKLRPQTIGRSPKELVLMALDKMSDSSKYRTTWIGNSFGGGEKWVQLQISSLYVAPDGTCYTNCLWDEAGREVGIYKDGDVLGLVADLHIAGRHGGQAVSANQQYLFVGMEEQQGEAGQMLYGVCRYDLQGNPVPFPNSPVLSISTTSPVPVLIGTLGEQGGVFTSKQDYRRGEVGAFRFAGLSGVGADRAGNLYVAQNGFNDAATGCSLSKFRANLQRLEWQLFGLEFMDCADVDPQSEGTDVYTKHEHFVMDW